jgi:hypothetical protein
MSQSLILIVPLSYVCWEEKEREMAGEAFIPGLGKPYWQCPKGLSNISRRFLEL